MSHIWGPRKIWDLHCSKFLESGEFYVQVYHNFDTDKYSFGKFQVLRPPPPPPKLKKLQRQLWCEMLMQDNEAAATAGAGVGLQLAASAEAAEDGVECCCRLMRWQQ